MKLSIKVIDRSLTDDVFDVFSGRCEYEAVNQSLPPTRQQPHISRCQLLTHHLTVITDDIVYTMSHNNSATLFLTITLVFCERFLEFLNQWKHE